MSLRNRMRDQRELAMLVKETIKMAHDYKVPMFQWSSQGMKRLVSYHEWIIKLKPIFSMYWQVCDVMPNKCVELCGDPEDVGNKAFYMLLMANIDSHFQ